MAAKTALRIASRGKKHLRSVKEGVECMRRSKHCVNVQLDSSPLLCGPSSTRLHYAVDYGRLSRLPVRRTYC